MSRHCKNLLCLRLFPDNGNGGVGANTPSRRHKASSHDPWSKAAIDSVLDVLDREIANRAAYHEKKELGLNQLKSSLGRAQGNDAKFELCYEIFEEYYCYQSDSAYTYARRALQLGSESGDSLKITRAQVAILRCFSSAGLLKEGVDMVKSINPAYLSGDNLVSFCTGADFLYDNLLSHVEGYVDLMKIYQDERDRYRSMALGVQNISEASQKAISINTDLVLNDSPQYEIERRREFVESNDLSLHEMAIQYACIANAFMLLNETQPAKYYYALSSIYDQRYCNNETMASYMLAELMYRDGDIARAARYINAALEEANFFNSRVRKLQINAFLPKIEATRLYLSESQKKIIGIAAAVFMFLLSLVCVLLVKVHHRNQSLLLSHRETAEKVRQLDEANTRLMAVNEKLQEADEIKNKCIMEAIYGNQTFADIVDRTCRDVERKVKVHQLDDVFQLLHNIGIKEEGRRTLATFDKIFLSVFPDFMEGLNKLLDDSGQLYLNEDGTMPTEARLFALLRFGISDTAVVSKYLNISPNSIYVYKAKVKAHAIVDKDAFEKMIMDIPRAGSH